MATFAEQLTAARKAANMTQEELAGAVHVTRTTISSWERGRTKPDVDSLKLLSEALQWDFLSGESAVKEEPAPPAEAPEPPAAAPAPAPAAEEKPRRKWLIPAVTGAAAVLLLCFLLFILPVLKQRNEPARNLPPVAAVNLSDMLPEVPEVLTSEWFRGGNLRAKNEPWLDIRTTVLVDTDSQSTPFWRYVLTFEEVAGHTFHFERLEWYCFPERDRFNHRSFSADSGAVWADDNGSAWEFIGGDPVQQIDSYGFIIYGHDDAGNSMAFRTGIDMTQAPRE